MKNVASTINEKRCMSCGVCSSICPVDAISMIYQKHEGFYRPAIDETKCVSCGKCMKVCPAEHQESSNLIGEYQELYLAHSTDANVRHWATSGGVINALVRYLLDKHFVQGVLMTGYSEESPIEAKPYILTRNSVSLLKQNPRDFASRYVTVPVLSKLKEMKHMKSVAVVGTPCQIIALKNLWGGYSQCEFLLIGITCSGGISYKATAEYKQKQNKLTAKMFYRGDGWPGKNSLISDNSCLDYAHNGSLFERMFSSQVFKNPGCRNCKDHFAEQADISFCDFWNEDERKSEHEGNSCVIVRSVKAHEIFYQMQQDGYVEVVRSLSETEIENGQMQILKAKKGKLHGMFKYRLFTKTVDFVFDHDLYHIFTYKTYQLFCKAYRKMCENTDL